MKKFMSKSLTVLITSLSWLVVSNHCALGAVVSEPKAMTTQPCPMHSQPSKQKDATDLPCCKTLRAVAVHPAKSFAAAIFFLAHVEFAAASIIPSPQIQRGTLALDTGPPGARTFAESVLQRSILAHAPPHRA